MVGSIYRQRYRIHKIIWREQQQVGTFALSIEYQMIFSVLASPPRFIDYSQLMEANRNAQNLQLAHEIVFNKDFQLQLPEYEKGR